MLGSPAAKRLQVLKVGPELVNMTTIYFKKSDINGIVGCFSKMFSGVGRLSAATSLTLHINREVLTTKAQKPRWIPYPLKEIKSRERLASFLTLTSTRKFLGPTSRVRPAVIASKPNKDDVCNMSRHDACQQSNSN